ncbi:MAG: Holliday junction resolvase RuvX [Clostridia bacterium]|nr:Holliday junction resolvase RuvX [Clostridia bacterium]MEE0411077.1 Holliday junction resolvase RuvX [Clostridia bacterium]
MRIMGIDFGDARVGVAVTDPLGITAQGVGTVKNGGVKKLMAELDAIIKEYAPEEIVIGLPKNMDGTEGFRAEATYKFAKRLGEIYDGRIEFVDERLTTVGASQFLNATNTRGGKRKDVIDTVSACLILETYMKRKNNS